jgi:peptide deformylase
MAVRPVVVYPHPRLKRVAHRVGEMTEKPRRVAEDLVDTMRANERCVGVSAPQIDEDLRIIVVDVSTHPKGGASAGLLVLADPEVVSADGWEMGREGCLSLPSITCDVGRHTSIVVRGLTPEGTLIDHPCDGFEARAVQHEIDHLDGILILDRVASPSEVYPRMSS